MNALSSETSPLAATHPQARSGLGVLLCFHIVVCCVSLSYVADYYSYMQILSFDQTRLYAAALIAAPFAVVAVLFTYGRFSFGYVLGFYFYTMILGYLWIVEFSKFYYDHSRQPSPPLLLALHFWCLRCLSPRRSGNGLSCRHGRSTTCCPLS